MQAPVITLGIVSAAREVVLRTIREELAPAIRADGGELYVVRVEDGAITLHLGGRYAGCPGNTLVRRRVIEPLLRALWPDAEIVVTSGVLVPAAAERVE